MMNLENSTSTQETNDYKIRQTKYLYTTRFNNHTYKNNRDFCIRNHLEGIYSVLSPLPTSIPLNSILYVIEMNNETEKITALSKVYNNRREEIYRIYEKESYNQKHYRAKKRIDVETQITDPIEQQFIQTLEYHCFKTKGHLKRGQGFTSFPWYKLATSAKNGFDVLDFLDKMFEKRKKKKKSIETIQTE